MIRYSIPTLIRHRIFLAPAIRADIAIDNLACAWCNEQRAGSAHRNTPRTVLILRLRFRQFFHSGFLCMRDARPASAKTSNRFDEIASSHCFSKLQEHADLCPQRTPLQQGFAAGETGVGGRFAGSIPPFDPATGEIVKAPIERIPGALRAWLQRTKCPPRRTTLSRVSLTEPQRIGKDSVKDSCKRTGRRTDDTQYLARRGLLLTRLGKFAAKLGDIGFLSGRRWASRPSCFGSAGALWHCGFAASRL
jgi:hypothetical protein